MVLAALGLLFAKKAVHAALGVALVMINLGVLYIAQDAEFLGIVQVFVYTGAVMMLFLFVLMLVGVDSSDSLVETIRGQRWVAPAARRSASACCSSRPSASSTFGRPVGPDAGQRRRQRHGRRQPHLRQVRVGVRGHQRAADHRRARRHGPGAPGAARPRAQPAELVRAAVPRRHAPSPACPRPACTPGTTRSTPRRCCRTAPPSELSVSRVLHAASTRSWSPRGLRGRRAGHRGTRSRRGRRDEPRQLHLPGLDPLRDRRGAVLLRRNAIIVFMGVELMLNATNLALRHVRPHPRHARRPGHRAVRHGRRRRRGRRRAWPSSWPSSAPAARPRSTTPTC